MAAFLRRAGLSRIDCVPLHTPLFDFSMMLLWTCTNIYQFGGIAPTQEDIWYYTCYFAFLGPALLLAVLINAQNQRSREALLSLRDFELENAQCYGAGDREAIQELIGEWFADDPSLSPFDRRALGIHNFENYVRYDLAIWIEQQNGGLWFLSMRSNIVLLVFSNLPGLLDYAASPGVSVLDWSFSVGRSINFWIWCW